MNILIVSILVLIINVPFGMWRANTKKFSLQWVLSIHLPIPAVVALRFLFNLGFKWWTYPFLVAAFFLGQLTGKKVSDYRKKNNSSKNSDKE